MKNLFYASHMRLVYFQRFFAFFSFLFLDSWIEILDILLNNASHSRFVSSLASSRLESSKTLRLLREEEEERTKR